MLCVAAHPFRWTTASRPRRWRQRGLAGPPHRGAPLDTDRVGQPEFAEPGPPGAVVAIAGIGQHDSGRNAVGQGLGDLLQCDPRLGLEDDIIGNAGFAAPCCVGGPFLRQIELVGGKRCSATLGIVRGSGRVIRLPVPRHQFVDALLRPAVDEACQQIREIGLRIDAIEFAGLDQ
jgi:hypothetical protein